MGSGNKMTLLNRYSELMILDKIRKLAVNLAANGREPIVALSESALAIGNNSTCERMNELYEWGDVSGRGINTNYAKGFDDRDWSPRRAPEPPPTPKALPPRPIIIPHHPKKPEEELIDIVKILLKNGITEKQLFDLFNRAIEMNKPKAPTAADFEDHPGFDGAHFEKPEPVKPLKADTSPEDYVDFPGADGSEYERPTYKDQWWYKDMEEDDKEWFDSLPPEKQEEYEDEMKGTKRPEKPAKKEAVEFKQQLMGEWINNWHYLAGIDVKKSKKDNR